MPFKKGFSGNPKGRATGAANKVNRDLREIVRALVEDNAEQVRQDLAALDPKERVSAWLKLTEFILPKLQRTEEIHEVQQAPRKTVVIELPCDCAHKTQGGRDTGQVLPG